MSSVKGFSGPASEKIKLFFIGHRRRSAFFLMLTWDAGWYRSACSAVISVICLPHSLEQPGRQRDLAQRSGLAQRPSERFLRSTAAVLACCVPKSSFEAVSLVCYKTLAQAAFLALGLGWHRRDRLRPRDTRTSLHLTPAPATPSLRAETLRRASHQLPRADDRDSDSDSDRDG